MPRFEFTKEDWIKLAGAILAALLAYNAAISAMERKIAVLEEREQNHYAEILRHVLEVKTTLDELRKQRP